MAKVWCSEADPNGWDLTSLKQDCERCKPHPSFHITSCSTPKDCQSTTIWIEPFRCWTLLCWFEKHRNEFAEIADSTEIVLLFLFFCVLNNLSTAKMYFRGFWSNQVGLAFKEKFIYIIWTKQRCIWLQSKMYFLGSWANHLRRWAKWSTRGKQEPTQQICLQNNSWLPFRIKTCFSSFSGKSKKSSTALALDRTISKGRKVSQSNSVFQNMQSKRGVCPTQLICTWIFICRVGGGDSIQGVVKCSSSYFRQ